LVCFGNKALGNQIKSETEYHDRRLTTNDIDQFDDFAGEITVKADNSALACGKHYVVVWATDHMGK